jgi:hypothetical protein
MAHKGYTLNYFIGYFQSIPDHQWCTGRNQRGGTVQHCAQGHVLRDARTTFDNTSRKNQRRLTTLNGFLGTDVVAINDNSGKGYSKLGSTPRGRVLRALRNRKRYGNIYGKKKT